MSASLRPDELTEAHRMSLNKSLVKGFKYNKLSKGENIFDFKPEATSNNIIRSPKNNKFRASQAAVGFMGNLPM